MVHPRPPERIGPTAHLALTFANAGVVLASSMRASATAAPSVQNQCNELSLLDVRDVEALAVQKTRAETPQTPPRPLTRHAETPKRRNATILATLMPSAGVRRPRMSR